MLSQDNVSESRGSKITYGAGTSQTVMRTRITQGILLKCSSNSSSGEGPRFCISDRLPSDVNIAGSWHSLSRKKNLGNALNVIFPSLCVWYKAS